MVGLIGLTKAQVIWASTHDWCKGFRKLEEDSYIVLVRDYIDNDSSKPIVTEFGSFPALKVWAGY